MDAEAGQVAEQAPPRPLVVRLIDDAVVLVAPMVRCTKKNDFGLVTTAGSLGAVLRVYNRKTAPESFGELPRDYKNSSKLTYSASK